jgi:hypothetical protein
MPNVLAEMKRNMRPDQPPLSHAAAAAAAAIIREFGLGEGWEEDEMDSDNDENNGDEKNIDAKDKEAGAGRCSKRMSRKTHPSQMHLESKSDNGQPIGYC